MRASPGDVSSPDAVRTSASPRKRGEVSGGALRVSSQATISYAQRHEDMRLLDAFGEQSSGFYIDVGAGHPVYDNVSFAFYLRGWRGLTVEPNPWLAQLSAAVRPRDIGVESLVGADAGTATYHLVEDFHGLSTMVEGHARAAQSAFGKASRAMTMPVTTLRALCERHAPEVIDFLKIDVEGAEHDVLAGCDWRRFRPKVVLAEALEPITLAEAWQRWEPLLTRHGYRFALFDGLNRYYVADEHGGLAERLTAVSASTTGATPFSSFKPAVDDPTHPDHALACLLAGIDVVRLPLLPSQAVLERLLGGLDANDLDRPAQTVDRVAIHRRLFGSAVSAPRPEAPSPAPGTTIRDLYRQAVETDAFRAACGRISASSAW